MKIFFLNLLLKVNDYYCYSYYFRCINHWKIITPPSQYKFYIKKIVDLFILLPPLIFNNFLHKLTLFSTLLTCKKKTEKVSNVKFDDILKPKILFQSYIFLRDYKIYLEKKKREKKCLRFYFFGFFLFEKKN